MCCGDKHSSDRLQGQTLSSSALVDPFALPCCLGRVTIAVAKHHYQKKLGKERVYCAHSS